jgi:hypothetical protein
MNQTKWSENVILADADYIDRVAFDLTVNFERMLERRIPKANLAQWLECAAMDGGLKPLDPAATPDDDGRLRLHLFNNGKQSRICVSAAGIGEDGKLLYLSEYAK